MSGFFAILLLFKAGTRAETEKGELFDCVESHGVKPWAEHGLFLPSCSLLPLLSGGEIA